MAESAIFGRTATGLPRAVAGDGCWLIDEAGRRYLDGSGGAAVSCLGHSDVHVKAAITAQLDRLPFAHTGFFTTDAAEAMASKLVSMAPGDLARVYPLSGGSEANEAALKLARQYALETGEASRHRVIARRQSYHGNTLGALATGGNAARRANYAPLLIEVSHIAPCYAYREQMPGESAAAYGLRTADELEAEILQLGPETVLAFMAEPVVGATAGAVPPVPGYFSRIREICDRYGVLLILDEVMCGMGRTGTLFACEQDGVAPDILTVAKGLGAGYVPAGAMLVSERIWQAITDGSGAFQHGHTYHGHPLSAAGALAVLERLVDQGVAAGVAERGARLDAALRDRFGDHPHVGDIRGRGLFRALELVADRDTKCPFDPAERRHVQVKRAALAKGLICYPAGGTVDGTKGDHILLAPPFIISDDEITELVDRLSRAMDIALA